MDGLGAGAGAMTEEAAAPGAARRGRTVVGVAVATAVLLLVGVIGAFTVSGGDATTDVATGNVAKVAALPPGQVVPAAAAATAQAGSAAFEMTVKVDITDNGKREKVDLDASGALDFAGKRGHMTEQVTAADGTKKSLDLVLDGTAVYISGPALAGKLPAGKTAVKIDATGGLGGIPTGTSNPADALQSLSQLGGSVTQVGRESVRGVDTVHYSATIDPSKASGSSGSQGLTIPSLSVPVDVWIDGDGRVRRMRTAIDLDKILGGFGALFNGQGPTGSIALDLELFDFGKSVDVKVPAPSAVADSSSVGGLDQLINLFGIS